MTDEIPQNFIQNGTKEPSFLPWMLQGMECAIFSNLKTTERMIMAVDSSRKIKVSHKGWAYFILFSHSTSTAMMKFLYILPAPKKLIFFTPPSWSLSKKKLGKKLQVFKARNRMRIPCDGIVGPVFHLEETGCRSKGHTFLRSVHLGLTARGWTNGYMNKEVYHINTCYGQIDR